MFNHPTILNSKGEPIVLNDLEQRIAIENERKMNALGFEIPVTTLTTIMKKITEQKFFEVAPADYLPVKVGEGSWSSNLTTYRSFQIGGDFADGVINLAGNGGRLASADAGVDSLTIAVKNWANEIGWSLFELQEAAKSGNWDLISAKEKSRKTLWDLGIQRTAFLGLPSDSSCVGLLALSGVTSNTTLIQVPISSMSPADLKQFCIGLLNAYRVNTNRTAWPSHFIIPESDYLGLAGQASADFPIKSTLQVLEEAFSTMVKKPFKILPLAYADAAYNMTDSTHQVYTLLNYDDSSLVMNIPVDYTNSLANTVNGFSYQNVGYGQFTGVQLLRPLELMYFKYAV